MIEESKYCSKVMKKHFNEKLVMTIEDNENFKNSSKCWICDNDYIDNDVIAIDIIVILLEKIEALHIEIVISILNYTNSGHISQPKKLSFPSFYARTRQIQS